MTDSHTIPWLTREILDATGGELLSGDMHRSFAKVFIDSRNIPAEGLFVAISGEVHDGHTFLTDVVLKGVHGLVVSRAKADQLPVSDWKAAKVACIAVDDTTRALGALAAFNRGRAAASVVGITGSNGKTTTRQMTATVVEQQFNTLATAGNFNNEIGLPLTLLELAPDHQWAVVELGTNNPGEIARLAAICTPDIGVITNIGPAHLEGLGSIEGVAREKGSLLNGLAKGGRAVLNADDWRVLQLAGQTQNEVILYGLSEQAAVRATEIREDAQGIRFILKLAGKDIPIRLNTSGRFMVTNALAAAAVGNLMGMACDKIKAGLESFAPVSGRMTIFRTTNGINVIDDTYNANPDSMKAALRTLKSMRAGSRAVFVAGDMLELGNQAPELHKDIGSQAVKSGISRLYVRGDFAESVASGALAEGLKAADMFTGTRREITADLIEWLQPGDWVLVKGSRGMAMEKVVQGIKDWAEK